ncbi:hypothetical protein AOLI_G00064400 [Acnodon oligacanthus]
MSDSPRVVRAVRARQTQAADDTVRAEARMRESIGMQLMLAAPLYLITKSNQTASLSLKRVRVPASHRCYIIAPWQPL